MSEYPGYPMRRPVHDGPRTNGGRLWAGGVATAVVAALIATLGILVARGLFHVAIFAPKADGAWGNAHTLTYALASAAIALAATGVLHFLLVTTPRATVFFGWIMVLLVAVAVVVPLTVATVRIEMIATIALDVLIGLVITGLLVGAAHGARVRMYRPVQQPGYGAPGYGGQGYGGQGYGQQPGYDTAEWYGR